MSCFDVFYHALSSLACEQPPVAFRQKVLLHAPTLRRTSFTTTVFRKVKLKVRCWILLGGMILVVMKTVGCIEGQGFCYDFHHAR